MISPTATPSSPLDRRAFQQLKTRIHRRLVDAIDLSKAGRLDEAGLREQLRSLAEQICSREEARLSPADREAMALELMDEIFGFGPLEPLMRDPDVTDVLVNGPDRVFVERAGVLEETQIRFADDAHLMRVIRRLVARAGRRIDELSPIVEARLPDGSRLNAVVPPLAAKGPTLSIRRFSKHVLTLDDLIRRGTLTREMAEFLKLSVLGRRNLLISGGSGAGKTTLLGGLARFLPPRERIITIEQTAELRLDQPDVVSLETRPANVGNRGEISQRELLKSSLRLRPDRVIVGEIRGEEAFELLQAMTTGHEGSMATLHANEVQDALDRLELMIALSGIELPTAAARRYIASAIDILVHIARLSTGERKITRISELAHGSDGVSTVEDIFVYRLSGVDQQTHRADGAFFTTGCEPRALRQLAAQGIDVPPDMFKPRELQTEI